MLLNGVYLIDQPTLTSCFNYTPIKPNFNITNNGLELEKSGLNFINHLNNLIPLFSPRFVISGNIDKIGLARAAPYTVSATDRTGIVANSVTIVVCKR